jgi:ribonuclease E
MTKRMLLDTSHPEETRVVVMSGNRLDEFDYETKDKQQLKGNIYLAKVTRVEPSLQAAFVDYGGNRHGFLPFSEIHPDYYRLPIADREALIAEEQAAQRSQGEEDAEPETAGESDAATNGAADGNGEAASAKSRARRRRAGGEEDAEDGGDPEVEQVETAQSVETLAGDDIEDAARRRAASHGRYKIQEVIKRRQVMLVQVVKEERGNKGAALTTYLSLAGRYCVLMPNTNKGGGISRKIASAQDRKRLKGVLSELLIPEGMAVIVRTAGSQRSKLEIKRDYEYLLRLWDEIRSTTLQSTAPSLIYEEANLIKRAVRDLYTRDMDEILVEGDEGYKAAKKFMKSLMPSHAKKVKKYDDAKVPILHRYQVEGQLDNIHNPTVQLKSGGYIVMNQTEALVAIDVNSGKATKERHIEETALKTNLEAADEVARQLKLRDLAGLIVIDFIDMDQPKHNREVESKLKEAMRQDRARIQLGRISPFGLLELSRQRLRPSLHETSTEVCKTCGGSGFVRSPDSTALHVLRALEEEGIKRGGGEVLLTVPTGVALYVLNDKRERLIDVEHRYGFRVRIDTDDRLVPPAYRLDRLATAPVEARQAEVTGEAVEVPADEELIEDDGEVTEVAETGVEDGEDDAGKGGKGRRRGRRGGRGKKEESTEQERSAAREAVEAAEDQGETDSADAPVDAPADGAAADAQAGDRDAAPGAAETAEQAQENKRRRRRGKRGGRRRAKRRDGEEGADTAEREDAESDTAASDSDDGDGRGDRERYGDGETYRDDDSDGDGDGELADDPAAQPADTAPAADPEAATPDTAPSAPDDDAGTPARGEVPETQAATAAQPETQAQTQPETETDTVAEAPAQASAKPKAKRSRSRKTKSAEPESSQSAEGEAAPAKPKRSRRTTRSRKSAATPASASEDGAAPADPAPAAAGQGAAEGPTGAEPTGAERSDSEPSAPDVDADNTAAAQADPSRANGLASEPPTAPGGPETVPAPPGEAGRETAFGEAAQPSGGDDVADSKPKPKRRGWWKRLAN